MDQRLELISILNEYPLLVPSNYFKKWIGFISVKSQPIKIVLNVPHFPKLEEITWELPLQSMLLNSNDLIECKSLFEYLKALQNLMIKKLESNFKKIDKSCWNEQKTLTYKQLIIDIEKSLNSYYIVEIGKDFEYLIVGYKDSQFYTHTLGINLCFNEQKIDFKIKSHDLPVDAITLLTEITSLPQLFLKFEELIESLIPFWNICNEIEVKTWVIDPTVSKRSDTHRQIYLAEDLSVLLKLNPFDMNSLPEIKFLGSIKAVKDARDKIQTCLDIYDGWDCDLTVLENLERLLEHDRFLTKDEVESKRNLAGNSNDCLICFNILSEQPLKYCMDQKCSALFHLSCLLKWFECSRTSDSGLNNAYFRGPCPCCENLLYCPRNFS